MHDLMENLSAQLRKGGFIVVYDGDEREGEADLMFHASFARPDKIEKLRKDAGGLVCLAIDGVNAGKIGLKFMGDILRETGYGKIAYKRTAYGDEPAFSLAINHKDVYTGITDEDRALTIRKMEECVRAENPKEYFENSFYAPGHVFLLVGRGIEVRKGHTELSLELARIAGLSGAMVMCEMLGKGKALGKREVSEYARRNGFPFIEGKKVLEKAGWLTRK